MDVESAEAYYDKTDFADWVHPISKTRMLKAQHPDYELFQQGVHAKRGVSCADCHMPYKSEGGQKFTDHHIGSPLENVENSCFVCHREKVSDLVSDVYERQRKIKEGTSELQTLIAKAHIEAGKAWELGATEEQMKEIQKGIRHAQWRWDYSVASHGAAFHAPLETSRIVTSATRIIMESRLKLMQLLNSLGHSGDVEMPNLNSKEALQEYTGIDIKKGRYNKEKFLVLIKHLHHLLLIGFDYKPNMRWRASLSMLAFKMCVLGEMLLKLKLRMDFCLCMKHGQKLLWVTIGR
jgi:nitrite reductase (cytochrome c-552)